MKLSKEEQIISLLHRLEILENLIEKYLNKKISKKELEKKYQYYINMINM